MATADLEARIARLEAIEAIKQLKARYCELCDQGYQPDGLAALFTEDAVWDGGPRRGKLIGRAAIRQFFAGVSKEIPFARHLVMNPIIEAEGDRATGRWQMFMPFTLRQGGKDTARWQVGSYVEEYARVGGQWLFKHLAVEITYLDPETQQWRTYGP
ncbi:MAG: nuclear transport factor 2 family protein [Alphaproteobacteria bacterium]|nr:nuclear transport factor 2 family protein [Alphaproteobacteria bacterium]